MPLRFLIIDDNGDSRALLVRTLARKFPTAVIQEAVQSEKAVLLARSDQLDAIVTHRTFEHEGVSLVSLLRQANPSVPILMVSGIDRERGAIAAGATKFMDYEEWLRVGTVMTEMLSASRSPFSADKAPEDSTESQPV